MNTHRRLQKLCAAAVALAAIITAASVAVIYHDEKAEAVPDGQPCALRLAGSYYTQSCPEGRPIPEDGDLELDGHNHVTFKGRFSQAVPEGQLLIFRLDNVNFSLFINGQPVLKSDGDKPLPHYIQSAGNGWGYYVSPGVTPEDDVRVEMTNLYLNHPALVYRMFLSQMYAGYAYPLIFQQLNQHLINVVGSVLLLCLGIVAGVYALFLKRGKERYSSVAVFAAFCLCAGVWFFIEFQTIGYFFPYPLAINALDILSLILMAALLELFLGVELKSKARRLCFALAAAFALLALFAAARQFFSHSDFYQIIPVLQVLIIAACVFNLGCLVYEWRCCPRTARMGWLIVSCACLACGIAGDLILHFCQLSFSLGCFKLGFMAFCVLQLLQFASAAKTLSQERAKMRVLETQHIQLEKVYKYQQMINEATKGLYENILEVDLTNDRFVGDASQLYLAAHAIAEKTPFSQAVHEIAMTSVHPEDRQRYLDALTPANAQKAFEAGIESLSLEFRFMEADGAYHWIELNGRAFRWSEDESLRLVLFRRNIDDEKHREEALHQMALKDGLTGLLNKAAFEATAKRTLYASQPQTAMALMVLDVDRFKTVNDEYGHQMGDYALQSFAAVLANHFRKDDLVGRVGGDEFAVLLRYNDRGWLQSKADRLIKALNMTLEKDGQTLRLTASAGIAVCTAHTLAYDQLFKLADEALYAAKTGGRNSYRINGGRL